MATQNPRVDGILVIVKADNCGGCIAATAAGLFTRLEDELNLGQNGRIAPISMKMMGPTNEAAVFNLPETFPRFMYILARDFDQVCNSGVDYQSVVGMVRFFNYTYNPVSRKLDDNQVELPFSLVNIQAFCDASMLSLLQQTVDDIPPSQPILVPRYRRIYY